MKVEPPLTTKTTPQAFDAAPDNRKPWRPSGYLIGAQKYYLANDLEPFFNYVNRLRVENNQLKQQLREAKK